ncbi:MAG: sodium dependent phosphate transporter, partial [Vicinamibacteria bacterium]
MAASPGSAADQVTLPPVARGALVIFFLYVFLVGIAFLEAGIASTGEGFQANLLASVSNPLSGLCAGLLATVLVQSSSVSTSTIV